MRCFVGCFDVDTYQIGILQRLQPGIGGALIGIEGVFELLKLELVLLGLAGQRSELID